MPRGGKIIKTPEHIKEEILNLHKTQPDMKKTQIAQRLKISHSVVYDTINKSELRICSACKKRVVPEKPYKGTKLTRLCPSCFTKGSSTLRPVSRIDK